MTYPITYLSFTPNTHTDNRTRMCRLFCTACWLDFRGNELEINRMFELLCGYLMAKKSWWGMFPQETMALLVAKVDSCRKMDIVHQGLSLFIFSCRMQCMGVICESLKESVTSNKQFRYLNKVMTRTSVSTFFSKGDDRNFGFFSRIRYKVQIMNCFLLSFSTHPYRMSAPQGD